MLTCYEEVLQECKNCQCFLNSVCEIIKSRKPHLSMRSIANILGFDHAANLSMALNGKRTLSLKLATSIGQKLKLSDDFLKILELMARRDNSNIPSEVEFFNGLITKLRSMFLYFEIEIIRPLSIF